MLDLVYIILCILSIININIKGINSFYNDYMDLENTNAIKGVFVWMIFFRHYTGYLKHKFLRNKISILIDKYFKQNIVSLFLFYSGYGIFESFKKKGNNYIKSLPIKSLIILIKSEIILIFFLCNNLILGIKITMTNFIEAMIFYKSIGNSYWFSFAIITLYIYSFFSFYFIKNQKYNIFGIFLITIISYFHILFVYKFYHPKKIISVNTIICFVLGFYYSFFKLYIDKIIMKNDIIYLGITTILILKYYKYYIYSSRNIYIISLKNGFFTLIVILITMKIRLKNNFLFLLSSHSYTIYFIQKIVMIYIHKKGLFKNSEFIGFFFEFILVIAMSIFFDKYSNFIDKLLKSRNIYLRKNLSTNKLNKKNLLNIYESIKLEQNSDKI